jgi:hypothetical protein
LAFSTIALHWSRSCVRLSFCVSKPIVFRSTESSHVVAGLPTHWVLSTLRRVNSLQGFCSCIVKSFPSHFNPLTLITFAI